MKKTKITCPNSKQRYQKIKTIYPKDEDGYQLTITTIRVRTKTFKKIYDWTKRDGTVEVILNHDEIIWPKHLRKNWFLKAIYWGIIKKTFYE